MSSRCSACWPKQRNARRPRPSAHLVEEHQTKGGLNERVRAHLLASGWFDVPASALDETTRLNYKKLG